MDEALVRRRLVILGLLSVGAVLAWWPHFGSVELFTKPCPVEQLCVVFMDVGQGDAIFIESPTGVQMLIDGGRDSQVLRGLSRVAGFFDRQLDYVLITHPDADHVGGLTPVFDRYQIGQVIRTENESDTPMWQSVAAAIEEEGSVVHYTRRGQVYNLGGGVTLRILFPDIDASELESNTASIVAKLSHGDIDFLLTGDAPKSIEEYLVLIEGEYLASEVLKVGHHGSRTSTSELFLSEVRPTYAVISAGRDNSYGHPHVEVTDALFNAGAITTSTAEKGHVIFVSDGVGLEVR